MFLYFPFHQVTNDLGYGSRLCMNRIRLKGASAPQHKHRASCKRQKRKGLDNLLHASQSLERLFNIQAMHILTLVGLVVRIAVGLFACDSGGSRGPLGESKDLTFRLGIRMNFISLLGLGKDWSNRKTN